MPKIKTLSEKRETEIIRELRCRLRNAKYESGLANWQIAEMCGISTPTVSNMLNHPETASINSFIKICVALGVELKIEEVQQ